MVYSYGREFAPGDVVGEQFRAQLARRAERPIEFYEISLDSARQEGTPGREDDLLTTYLTQRFATHQPDLMVTIGAAAARFFLAHRANLFPAVPALIGSVEPRMIRDSKLGPLDAVVTARLDLLRFVDSIVAIRPEVRHVTVVLGASDNEIRWRAALERDFARYRGKLDFEYTNDLTLQQIRDHVAALPKDAVILYGVLSVDAAGVPHPREDALHDLSAIARVPVFGLFEHQLGLGIVGGPLASLTRVGDVMADSSSRILAGEAVDQLRNADASSASLMYDWRQLERWKIPESRLPRGSLVRYRPGSLWEQHAGLILSGLAIIVAQMAFLIMLAVQRTKLRAAEAETRHLSTRLMSANEDERRRLARDLHDDFSHRLARLSLDAAQLERAEPQSHDAPRILHHVRQELSHLAQDIHDVSHRLHPTTLEDLGLADALRTECDQLSRSSALRIDVEVEQLPKHLPAEIALCAFRIAQEALRNVSRHAQASVVNVEARVLDHSLSVAVRDNGIGFDAEGQREAVGLGHASMRERARLLGGAIKIESVPGLGTSVQASLPLAAGPA